MAQVTGSDQLRALSARLKAAGDDGQKLRRKMTKAMNDSVQELARNIADPVHLKPYMPDRYADVLAADLAVRISNAGRVNPRIELRAKAREHRRKLVLLDRGIINHPVYARGDRRTWNWSNAQTGGMRPGFFSDAVEHEEPQIRDGILRVMSEIAREITGP